MTEKLTKDQAVIISGFTGILCGEFSDFHADVEKRLGRGVQTFEFGFEEFMAEVKKLYEADFIKIGTIDSKAAKAQVVPEGFVLVPKINSEDGIDSMALRYRHDFPLLDETYRNGIRSQMRQLYEEAIGLGFYTHQKY